MRFARVEDEEAGLGLAPLIDVVLLLLIFFLVTTSFTEPRLGIELPESKSAEAPGRATWQVTLAADGTTLLDGEKIDSSGLEDAFERAADDEAELELRADKSVEHGRVVEVLGLARSQGVTRIGIAVSPAP